MSNNTAEGQRAPRTMAGGVRWIVATVYLGVLSVFATRIPLRLDEVLQLAGSGSATLRDVMHWVALTPATAPLNYLLERPFILYAHTPLITRAISLLAIAGSLVVFWRIAERVRIRGVALVVGMFATAPISVALALLARPGAQALFFALLATLFFLQIVEKPSIPRICFYGLALTAAIYTAPLAYAPAIGYLIFFFRFVAQPQQRRTIWWLLPATFVPLLASLPFYAWAAPQAADRWLYATPIPHEPAAQLWEALRTAGIGALVQIAILSAGAVAGVWASFLPAYPVRWSDTLLRKNISIFCLFGGVVATIAVAFTFSFAGVGSIELGGIGIALPLLILVFSTGIEYHRFGQKKLSLLPALAVLLIAIGIIQDARLPFQGTPDMQALADAAATELTGDTCVVFVSEHLSRSLFAALRPELAAHECRNFFHSRIILAVHPWVRPDQLEDAETFFQGLTYVPARRTNIGGGEVILLKQAEAVPATRE